MARQRGIGHNPTLFNQNLNANIHGDDENQWYDNVDRTTTRLFPSENPNNYGSRYGISMNQNFVPQGDPNRFLRSGIGSFYNDPGFQHDGSLQGPQLNTLDPNWQNELAGYGSTMDRGNIDNTWRNTIKDKFSKAATPLLNILRSQQDNPEEAFGKKYYGSSIREGRVNRNPAQNLHGDMNVSSGFGVGLGEAGAKRIARIEDTIAGFADQWGNLKKEEEQGLHTKYSDKLARHREKLKQFRLQKEKYDTAFTGQGPKEEIITDITSAGDQIDQGKGGGYQPQGGYSTQGGFTGTADPVSGGVRGHHGDFAQGGRAGYAFGDRVEQETDFIEGPQGGEEFQETVVEGQEQPSREQLEALAMHIFQLPLEQLDEQQLVVVYQAAMKEQPMEEAVQEEDVQFAANGGRMGYYGGELVEQQTDFLEGPRDDLMASGTSVDDGRNELSLQLFGKELHLLNEIELDQLEEEVQRLMGKFRGAEGGLASIL